MEDMWKTKDVDFAGFELDETESTIKAKNGLKKLLPGGRYTLRAKVREKVMEVQRAFPTPLSPNVPIAPNSSGCTQSFIWCS